MTRHADEAALIRVELGRLLGARKRFTVDQLWDVFPKADPTEHQVWLGQFMQTASKTGRARIVAYEMSARSGAHGRPVPVWVGVPANNDRPKKTPKRRKVGT